MKRSPPALACLLAAVLFGGFAAASGNALQRGPRLEIEPGEWDFGRAAPGEVLVREFALKNTGQRDLEIGRIASACACAAAVTDRTVIPPGEAATLRVTLETRRYRGVLERWLTIRSNGSRGATRLKVRVYVEAAG